MQVRAYLQMGFSSPELDHCLGHKTGEEDLPPVAALSLGSFYHLEAGGTTWVPALEDRRSTEDSQGM